MTRQDGHECAYDTPGAGPCETCLSAEIDTANCPDCGHQYANGECVGPPTPSDLWAGVPVSTCDCEGICGSPTQPSEDDVETYCGAEYGEVREGECECPRHNESPAALRAQVIEAQHNALEMARKADLAERRAEEAECHVEELRDALDSAERKIERTERLIGSWERDAPDHSNPVFIGRLRECLRRDPAPIRLRNGGAS